MVKKHVSINKTSKATATRYLLDMVEKEILVSTGAGRSVSYQLNLSN